jgi:hypothetical protein
MNCNDVARETSLSLHAFFCFRENTKIIIFGAIIEKKVYVQVQDWRNTQTR